MTAWLTVSEPMRRLTALGLMLVVVIQLGLLAYVARVAERVVVQRDVARDQVARVKTMCAVRVSDGYAECKPGAVVWSGTTTTVGK